LFLILAYKDQHNFLFFHKLCYSFHFPAIFEENLQSQLPVVFSKFISSWKTEIYGAMFHDGKLKKKKKFLSSGVILVLDYEEEVVEKVGCTLIINSRRSLI
jgi:hypothetical protein